MAFGGVDCGAKCAKIFLFVFNFVFWLTGLAFLGLGIWAYVDEKSLTDRVGNIVQIAATDGVDLELTAILFMAVGGFIMVVGFCGCCGAIKESRCLLTMYIIFLVIIMVVELAVGILGVVYRDTITDKLKDEGEKYIKEKYNSNKTDVTLAWNYVMQTFECCGMNGPQDFAGSKFDNDTTGMVAPQYCCVPKGTDDFDQDKFEPKNMALCTAGLNTCAVTSAACVNTDEHYYNQGCYQSVLDFIKDNYLVFIVVALVVGGLELFGLIFAICLCRAIGKND